MSCNPKSNQQNETTLIGKQQMYIKELKKEKRETEKLIAKMISDNKKMEEFYDNEIEELCEIVEEQKEEIKQKNKELQKLRYHNQECPICFEEFTKTRNVTVTNCGHAFHIDCFLNSMISDSEKRCPCCRNNLQSDVRCISNIERQFRIKTRDISRLEQNVDTLTNNVNELTNDNLALRHICDGNKVTKRRMNIWDSISNDTYVKNLTGYSVGTSTIRNDLNYLSSGNVLTKTKSGRSNVYRK